MTRRGELEGKVALVTGGTSGIGAAVVKRFIDEGARVVILSRSSDQAHDLPQTSHAVRVIAGDVRTVEANTRAVSAAMSAFGRLDIFVGNAGIYDNRTALAQYECSALSASFDELFSINVKGYILGARAALPELERNRGTILFTGSVSGVSAGYGGALYVAAKHAIVGLTKQLAYELAPLGVRVNCVAPGYAATGLHGLDTMGHGKTTTAPAVENLPLGEFATPNDYAEAYVLLASEAGRRMATGTVLVLDGGTAQTGPGPRSKPA